MKIYGGVVEDGIIAGNIYDKYRTRNSIVRLIMKEFEKSLTMLVDQVKPGFIHEVVCGEGYWVINWHKQGVKARVSDVSEKVIESTRDNADKHGISRPIFSNKNICGLSSTADKAELWYVVRSCRILTIRRLG